MEKKSFSGDYCGVWLSNWTKENYPVKSTPTAT